MSKLQELIKELCPDGVEFRNLGEGCEITIGEFVHKNKQIEDGKYPVYNGGRENTGFYESYNNIGNKVIISARGANAGYVNKVLTNYWAGNSCYSLFPLDVQYLNWFFLYYVLKSKEKELMGNQQTGSIPALSKKQIEQIEIPLPPLEVQNEIVRILDTFTSHAAELQAELQARKEQYEYYRNKLLTFDENDEGVKWMKLGEICDMKAGKSIPASEISSVKTEEFQYPCYGGNGLRGYVSIFNQEGEKVLIGRQGALCGNVCFAKNLFYATEHAVVVSDKGYCLPRYSFYLLTMMDLNQYKTAGAQPGLSVSRLEKISIPVPPLFKQQRIVSILDEFESLVNDLTTGLPAEIAAVQEQYEYYRNKLLTFERKS